MPGCARQHTYLRLDISLRKPSNSVRISSYSTHRLKQSVGCEPDAKQQTTHCLASSGGPSCAAVGTVMITRPQTASAAINALMPVPPSCKSSLAGSDPTL